MDGTRPTLPQRVTAVLHAKQYLVFFAIGLYALDFAVPIASAWLYRREPPAELLRNTWGPLADAVAARSRPFVAHGAGHADPLGPDPPGGDPPRQRRRGPPRRERHREPRARRP